MTAPGTEAAERGRLVAPPAFEGTAAATDEEAAEVEAAVTPAHQNAINNQS